MIKYPTDEKEKKKNMEQPWVQNQRDQQVNPIPLHIRYDNNLGATMGTEPKRSFSFFTKTKEKLKIQSYPKVKVCTRIIA